MYERWCSTFDSLEYLKYKWSKPVDEVAMQ